MKLSSLKTGNLLGSPDVKELLRLCDEAGGSTDALWAELAGIKQALGTSGQCSTFLIEEPSRPDLFPALVDPSPGALTLEALRERGLGRELIRSVLVTHAHGDHFDPALLRELPHAAAYAHAASRVPGCRPFPQEAFGPGLIALDTPGHGGPHSSYVLDLPGLDLAACLAGDLIMSHAHYLSLEHPYSFADHEAGRRSVAAVLDALKRRGRRHQVICPGHGAPFFVS